MNEIMGRAKFQQENGMFRGDFDCRGDMGELMNFQDRERDEQFERFNPRVSQPASDAVNRLIIAFHCALQWYFERSRTMNNQRCQSARTFASRGQMPGRWIRKLIEKSQDPWELPPYCQLYWIHSGAATEVMAEEFDLLLGSKDHAAGSGARGGAIPRLRVTADEHADIIQETLRALQNPLVTDRDLEFHDPVLVTLFADTFRSRRVSG
jgi:hypothetical protein